MTDLAQVLADARGNAQVLRRHGHTHDAMLIENLCDLVQAAAQPFLSVLSEEEAVLRSGKSAAFFRTRFPEWESQGLAAKDGRRRRYRECIVPRRANVDAAREAGRRAAHEGAA